MQNEGPVVLTVVVAFAVAALVIWFSGQNPRARQRTHELWAIYRSELLIAGAVLIAAALGMGPFLLALLAFTWRGQVEMFRLFDMLSEGRTQRTAMACAAVLVVAGSFGDPLFLAAILAAAALVVVLVARRYEPRSVWPGRARIAAGTLVLPALLVAMIAGLRAGPNGFAWIFFVYATAEIGDAFALLAGRLFGRSHPFPRLSPRKTAEGSVAGLIFGGGAGILVARFVLGLALAPAVRLTAVVLIAGLAGDLLTSALKRRQGKKDFSPVTALHGGVLDIYDAFLLAGPTVFLLRPLLLD